MTRRAFGSVRRRGKHGRWEVRYADSRGATHYAHFLTKGEAEAHLAAARTDMARGDWLDPKLARITVD